MQQVQLPKQVDGENNPDAYENLNFVLSATANDRGPLCTISIPSNWKLQATPSNGQVSHLLDKENRVRGVIDSQSDSATLKTRFEVSVIAEENPDEKTSTLRICFNDNATGKTVTFDAFKIFSDRKDAENAAFLLKSDTFRTDLSKFATKALEKTFSDESNPGAYWNQDLTEEVATLTQNLQDICTKLESKKVGMFWNRELLTDTLLPPSPGQ